MSKFALYALIFSAGFAALSWEVLWQLKLSLAIGFSALGTALTLATTMGGMTIGSLLMGQYLRKTKPRRPLDIYLFLELCIGISGLGLERGVSQIEKWDAAAFQLSASLASFVHLASLVALLGIPTLALGATIPVFRLISQDFDAPLSWLYGVNTAGASLGCLVIAFYLLPSFGISTSIWIIASINFLVAILAYILATASLKGRSQAESPPLGRPMPVTFRSALFVAFGTGFTTFALEVAWFRSLKASFSSQTESFALMLSSVLVAIALGARLAGWLSKKDKPKIFPGIVFAAGILILLSTPLVERFDLIPETGSYHLTMVRRFLTSLCVLGPSIMLLGCCLPWLLDTEEKPENCAKLYAANTLGAILGSLLSAWVFLPGIGFARSSWLLGVMVCCSAFLLLRKVPLPLAACLAGSLIFSTMTESGIGRQRVQLRWDLGPYKIIDYAETPESTISIVETQTGQRDLIIDGFVTTGDHEEMTHYMKWMGHLPMVLHPDPKDALVICFGTGQTANALVQEGAKQTDMVDLNAAVFEMADHFPVNDGVIHKAGVRAIEMDGRAWLRRSGKKYDVITLEPMAPTFAGVNNLYSREFYLLARQHLNKNGVICQWLPFHLLHPEQTLKIAATFEDVFPNSALWLDPVGFTGILVGIEDGQAVGSSWPGLERKVERSLTPEQIKRALVLDSAGLRRFTHRIGNVTDDNQELSYGSLSLLQQPIERKKSALQVIHWATTDPPPPNPDFKELLKIRVELPSTK